jgi:hypothetical protein
MLISRFDENGCDGSENSALNLAAPALEMRVAGIDISPLKPIYEAHLRSCEYAPGKVRRSPGDLRANSHDNFIALIALSELFDGGALARRMLHVIDGVGKGIMWRTSDKPDAEWILKPEQHRLIQIVCRTKSSNFFKRKLNDKALELNLLKAKSWNMKRVRLLLMAQVFGKMVGVTEKAAREMGDKYKGRYGDDPLYHGLWAINGGRYV